jgi:hypothetical protein
MARQAHQVARPPAKNTPKLVPLGVGAIWRVHSRSYRACQFNANTRGDARFSPIHHADGAVIPVLYGANTLEGAMMETVFHDVPTPPADYILDIEKLRQQGLVVSRFRPRRRLDVVDLSTKGLKRLGLHRTDLIDTPAAHYPATRAWAEWFHTNPEAKGLLWTSRQDDGARAMILFGDRVPESVLSVEVDREPLCENDHLDVLVEVAEHIGIDELFGV